MTTDLRAIRAQALREAQTRHRRRHAAGRRPRAPGLHAASRSRARCEPKASASAASRRTPTAAWIRRPSEASTRICACGRSCTKGVTASIREFLVGAFHAEMGLQACRTRALRGDRSHERRGATSEHRRLQVRPGARRFRAAAGLQRSEADADSDGKINEIDPALVDYVEFYLLNYFKPGQYRVTPRATQGLALMQRIGCTSCHVQNLTVRNDRRVADVETSTIPSAASSTTCSRGDAAVPARSPTRPRIRSCSRSAARSSSATCSRT